MINDLMNEIVFFFNFSLGASLANLNAIVKYSTRRLNNGFELDEVRYFNGIYNLKSITTLTF